jgi:hypothetical protein
MSGDAADGYQSLWLKAAPGDGLLDFVTAARAADGNLMTKVFSLTARGGSRPAATTRLSLRRGQLPVLPAATFRARRSDASVLNEARPSIAA